MTFELKKFDHREAKGIYAVAKRCKPRQIARLALDMAEWLKTSNGSFNGGFSSAYAVSHSQVEDEPWAFFVVAPQFFEKPSDKNFYFPAAAIFKAEILEAPEEVEINVPNRLVSVNPATGKEQMRIDVQKRTVKNREYYEEACMSFPLRAAKKVERFVKIKVRYQYLVKVLGVTIVRSKTEWVEGIKAHMFQHEISHSQGQNIYFK